MAEHKRSIRIQSDGTGPNTVITDGNGKPIEDILDATIYLEANEINRVSLTIITPKVDAHGLVTDVTLVCKMCGGFELHECETLTIGGS